MSQQFVLQDNGSVEATLEDQPGLDAIRELEREFGEPTDRIDINTGIFGCTDCNDSINQRFSADIDGNLLCWDCAIADRSTEEGERNLTTATDPAKVVLSESGLYHKSLCDYVINVATGCSHGCKFCYVPSTPNVTARQDMLQEQANVEDGQRDWGSYLLYRDDLPGRLAKKLDGKQKWNHTKRGRGVVMLSSGTDCYQDRRTAQITRGCIAELVKHQIPTRVLTRSPAVCRDLDLYKRATEVTENGMLVRVGSSIPSLDDEMVRAIEPNAPAPSTRLNALETLSDAGIPVYVSMSPTYPVQNEDDFDRLMGEFARLDPEVVFHEPINPRGSNFDMTITAARKAGQTDLAEALQQLKDRKHWVEYSLNQMKWAEKYGEKHGIDVHIWPDKQVISAVESETEDTLISKKKNPSPETFPEVPFPT